MKISAIKKFSTKDRIFITVNLFMLAIFLLIIIYPLLFVITASFSAGDSVMSFSLIPEKPTLEGYKVIFEHKPIWRGYLNSLIYMVSGTVISLIVTICCAYPLSRKDFRARGFVTTLCVITMFFNGGLIPTYLNIVNLKMIDTFWVMVIPGSLNVFNMIVMRTYFKSQIPDELLEASQLDGCGNFRFLIRIVIPLSGPIIAVMSLYVAVYLWNQYFEPLIFLKSSAKMPLQIILRRILVLNEEPDMMSFNTEQAYKYIMMRKLMRYSLIIVASAPVMMIYPFVQKYFVKGIMIGAIKG